jgi:hypothetical protein
MTNNDVRWVNEILQEIGVIIWKIDLKVVDFESIIPSGVYVIQVALGSGRVKQRSPFLSAHPHPHNALHHANLPHAQACRLWN